ncbi:MAG: uroporphyrinogen-III C-methyltransferase [Desulfomonile tiedjei]|uniref:uroporphyrinogen-III C-methyltransferase n=1 Tax=Desulfomonile tiedjei TaxID=2358 RepID=A0A9D6Z025_9BACT|nr:uroporphyrinogen-III C-methyltransferase [Desulfomonile tiedjei]
MAQTSKSKNEAPESGIVYLVGAGPGDPGLITVKGLEKIRSADVIVYDYLAGSALIREARPDAELIYVGKKGKNHTLEQVDINELLVRKATEGKKIVRLKGGDPYVFGRGGEEAEQLAAAGIPFEVVPGVTSAVAAPAYAGIPVTHRDHASMVTFITGHEDPTKEESAIDWEVLAKNPGTLVFLMGVKNLQNISESLIKFGKSPSTPVALVRWGTLPVQASLVSTLSQIHEEALRRGFQAPAVLVVGTAVSLRDTLGWFEKKPLFGKRILVTRGREQSKKMADAIRDQGGEAVLFPTISFLPPADYAPLDEAICNIAAYDWVIFTSVNGVERFFQRFFEVQDDIRKMAGPRIGAIGPVTASEIRKRGIKVDLLAKDFLAEGVLELFPRKQVEGKRFLIPRAEKAREILPKGLTEMGGMVDVVSVYRTGLPEKANVTEIKSSLSDKKLAAVTFTSSSTVTHFVEMMKGENLTALLDGVTIASIGPVTSATVKENGLPVHVEASTYTVDGLVKALAEYFRDQSA